MRERTDEHALISQWFHAKRTNLDLYQVPHKGKSKKRRDFANAFCSVPCNEHISVVAVKRRDSAIRCVLDCRAVIVHFRSSDCVEATVILGEGLNALAIIRTWWLDTER